MSGGKVGTATAQGYGPPRRLQRHHVTDGDVVSMALAVAVGTAWGVPAAAIAAGACSLAGLVGGDRDRRDGVRQVAVLIAAVALAALCGWRAERAWAGLRPDAIGPYQGWALVIGDPDPVGGATRVVVELDGERFELWARGRGAQARLSEWRAGDSVLVDGVRRTLAPDRRARVAWQHVVGEVELVWASDIRAGSPAARASNRVRALIERASGTALPADDAALFRGLVIGDDRDQPPAMVAAFRASGLSHLTAVSGQNVAFVLAAAGPLLRSLRTWPRLAVTLGLIAWFVMLTRFEPSILRAGFMAGLSAMAVATGRDRAPARVLGLAVIALLLIDPLLAWSIGFWLSVGATAGVVVLGPWLGARLTRWGPLAGPLGITLGAQIGVAVPSLLVFGRLPLVSVPANLLAVPVAGVVMLYGLPAGIVAGLVPAVAPVLMAPALFGVRWVDTVARLGARLEPGGWRTSIGWAVLAVIVAAELTRHRRPRARRRAADRRQ